MIDRYHPDLLYCDSPLPYPDEFGRKLLAHYYNDNARRHAGRVEAVYNCKQDSQGMWVQDLERGVMDKICPAPWQTDTCVGGWYYDVNLAQAHGYKSATTVIRDARRHREQERQPAAELPAAARRHARRRRAEDPRRMAAWMPVNGEAIFGTRPWKVFGEGAAQDPRRHVQRGQPALHGPRHPLHDQGARCSTPSPWAGRRTASCASARWPPPAGQM